MDRINLSRNNMTGKPVLSRKERERNARREEIVQAARELFILKGYHNTTLEEIAQHAELGKGTIYNYFSSKEELFWGIIGKLTAEMVELARYTIKTTAGGAREKLTAYAKVMISYSRKNSDLYHLVLLEIHRLDSAEHDVRLKPIRAGIRNVWTILAAPLTAEMKPGKIKVYDAFKVAVLFDSMIRFYCLKQFEKKQSQNNGDIDEVVTFIISVFFDGISKSQIKGKIHDHFDKNSRKIG